MDRRSKISLYKRLIEENPWIFLIIGASLFFIAIMPWINIHKLLLFLCSGISIGLFYGAHNEKIWPSDHSPKIYERTHFYWTHFIGGVAGGSAAYLLFIKSGICFNDPLMLFCSLDWVDLILFLVVLLGYSGYIPRTLWFMANKGVLSK